MYHFPKFASLVLFTDSIPFEVVKVNTAKSPTIQLRELDAVLDPSFKPEIVPGGFCGNCTNQDQQRYTYVSSPEAPLVTIRQSRAARTAGQWFDRDGNRYVLRTEPRKFHDYNF